MPAVVKSTSRAFRSGNPRPTIAVPNQEDKGYLTRDMVMAALTNADANFSMRLIAKEDAHTALSELAAKAPMDASEDEEKVLEGSDFDNVWMMLADHQAALRTMLLAGKLERLARLLSPDHAEPAAYVDIVRIKAASEPEAAGKLAFTVSEGYRQMCSKALPKATSIMLEDMCRQLADPLIEWLEARVYDRYLSELVAKRVFQDDVSKYQAAYDCMINLVFNSYTFSNMETAIERAMDAATAARVMCTYRGKPCAIHTVRAKYLESVRKLNAPVVHSDDEQ